MEKEITLPWTCETGEKIERIFYKVLHWTILTVVPAIAIISVTTNYLGFFSNGWFFYWLVAVISWLVRFQAWDEDGKIPHYKFKCKQQSNGTDSQ